MLNCLWHGALPAYTCHVAAGQPTAELALSATEHAMLLQGNRLLNLQAAS
jgi:hypothetical protein